MSTRKGTKTGSSGGGSLRQSPLGFYSALLLAVLVVTLVAHLLVSASLPLLEADLLSQPINGLFAILYAWILAGLTVCGLLFAWLRWKGIGIALSVIVLGVWLFGLRQHLRSPSLFLYVVPVIVGAALFWAGLRYASGHVLPVFDPEQASQAFAFVKKNIWAASRPGYILDHAEADESGARSGDLPSHVRASHPSFVFTGCDHAVAVSGRLRLKGVRDPGLVFIRPDERIVQVIDLRPQVRTFPLTARTQDGIQVQVRASVAFQIDAGRRRPTLGQPMPFSRAAMFKALHAQRVEHEGDGRKQHKLTPRLWDDLPSIRGQHQLRDIISRLDFDDLYGPHTLDSEPPRRRVARLLQERLQAILEPIGIQLLDVHLGNLEPADPQVYVKRARNWQTEWIRRITLTQAEGQVERLQILERARADARTELILDVGRQLESISRSKVEVGPDTVLDQFLVVLEALMTRPQLRDALPNHTKEVLSDVREAVGE